MVPTPRSALAAGTGLAVLGLAWSRGSIPPIRPIHADLTGRVAVVTGSNSGIGRQTALALASFGATVVLACRSTDKAEAAAADLRAQSPKGELVVLPLDLADLSSVRAFAAAFLERFDRLDILVNNAGRVVAERQLTVDGFEATVATNHLGPFLLTNLLLPQVEATGREHGPARIVNVASSTHRRGDLDLDDLMWQQRPYGPLKVYGTSKLMNVLFSLELARRVDPAEVLVNTLHPGNIHTGFGDNDGAPAWMRLLFPYSKHVFLTPERGADTSIWLAASPEAAEQHGGYFFRRRRWSPAKPAQDPSLAARLWDASAELVGLART